MEDKLFLKKKDAINITPFLDIMLVLFVLIIVASSFKQNINDSKFDEKKLLSKIENLEKKIVNLKKLNEILKKENLYLKAKAADVDIYSELINDCSFEVEVYDNYVVIGNKEYSLSRFFNLAKNGFIKKASFYTEKTDESQETYSIIKDFLKKLGWDFH